MDWLTPLLSGDVLVFLIPIVAIVGAFSVKDAKAYFRHVERMEMIRNGVDPDADPEEN
ncbi:MAG: hypothetical protein VB977_04650 [Pseudohongiellaceae bacterium]